MRVHLLIEPLQVSADVVFESLTVADLTSGLITVTLQCVHPVLVDQLRQTEDEDFSSNTSTLTLMDCCLS